MPPTVYVQSPEVLHGCLRLPGTEGVRRQAPEAFAMVPGARDEAKHAERGLTRRRTRGVVAQLPRSEQPAYWGRRSRSLHLANNLAKRSGSVYKKNLHIEPHVACIVKERKYERASVVPIV